MRAILSPCRKTCRLDPDFKYCEVCGRTSLQIQEWSNYTDDQRKIIMKELVNKRRSKNELGANN
jgi:predicted Fe-S protein YdhL (DUF1289 family)